MNILLGLFFVSLTLGQLAGIPVSPATTIYAHDIVLVMLLFAAVWKLKKKRIRRPKLFWPVTSFIGVGLLSLLINITRFPLSAMGQSSLYLVRWALYTGLYWVAFQDLVPALFWLWGVYASGIVFAFFGLVQYIWYPYLRNLSYLGWDPHLFRIFSTLFDPNFLGILFIFTLFVGAYLWKNRKYRPILAVGQGITTVAFLLTYSRSSYLAFIVALGVCLGLLKKWRLLIIIGVLFGGGLAILPRPGGEGVNLFRTVSTFARFGDWERGVALIREAPLFGYGFNTLRYVQRAKGWIDESQTISRAGAGLDNSFEFVWATTGVIGMAFYLWLLVRMFRLGNYLMASGKDRFLGILYVSVGAGVLVHGLFLNSLFYPWVLLWWWIVTGVVERTGDMRG
ncbi:O-antigen ligase family protein [Candidatus Gottesmanbacteria bacterium]|nr:O-antigen ligase family protein [Candidatus Gottesmanbacteria bacterium]